MPDGWVRLGCITCPACLAAASSSSTAAPQGKWPNGPRFRVAELRGYALVPTRSTRGGSARESSTFTVIDDAYGRDIANFREDRQHRRRRPLVDAGGSVVRRAEREARGGAVRRLGWVVDGCRRGLRARGLRLARQAGGGCVRGFLSAGIAAAARARRAAGAARPFAPVRALAGTGRVPRSLPR